MKIHALRLREGDDLKVKLQDYISERNITAGAILTTVGSLSKAVVRMPGALKVRTWEEELEIVSLVGTFSQDGPHLHLSVSNGEGFVFGGHMKEGCIVRTTAEVVIGELGGYQFRREFDENTGFDELVVEPC